MGRWFVRDAAVPREWYHRLSDRRDREPEARLLRRATVRNPEPTDAPPTQMDADR